MGCIWPGALRMPELTALCTCVQEQQPAAKRARHGASSSRGADATAAAVGAAGQEPVVLEQALEGFRLRDVSLFLRLTYHLEEAEPGKLYSGLYWELSSLAGAARLAHQLDAPRVLAALVAAMQRSGGSWGWG